MSEQMSDDEQKRLVKVMTEVSQTIYENARRAKQPAGLLACSRECWEVLGFAPEDYDVWIETGEIPERSMHRSRARALEIKSKNIS